MPHPTLSISQVIRDYLPLVRSVVSKILPTLPESVHADDLTQAGMIGLVEAFHNYNPDKGATFGTYAQIRIRGSIVDALRVGDWAPRSVHRSSRALKQAAAKLEAATGAPCSLKDLAVELNISIDEVSKIVQDTHRKTIVHYESAGIDQDLFSQGLFMTPVSPLEKSIHSEHSEMLSACLAQLPERERAAIMFHYDFDYSLKQIAEILHISESRVSQLIASTLIKLRKLLDSHQHGREI